MQNSTGIIIGAVGALVVLGVVVVLLFSGVVGPAGTRIDGQKRETIVQSRIVKDKVQRYRDYKITPTFTRSGGWALYLQYDYDLEGVGILIADERSIKKDSPIATKDTRIFWIGTDGLIYSYDTETHTYAAAPLTYDSFAEDDVASFDDFEWLVGVDEETGEFTFTHSVTGEEEAGTEPLPPEDTVVGGQGNTSTSQNTTSSNTETSPNTPANPTAPTQGTEGNGNTGSGPTYAEGSYGVWASAPPVNAQSDLFYAVLLPSATCDAVALPLQIQTDPVVSMVIAPLREIPQGTTFTIGARPQGIDARFPEGSHSTTFRGDSVALSITRYANAQIGTSTVGLSASALEEPFACTIQIINL